MNIAEAYARVLQEGYKAECDAHGKAQFYWLIDRFYCPWLDCKSWVADGRWSPIDVIDLGQICFHRSGPWTEPDIVDERE